MVADLAYSCSLQRRVSYRVQENQKLQIQLYGHPHPSPYGPYGRFHEMTRQMPCFYSTEDLRLVHGLHRTNVGVH